jgi:hypothetical protein
MAEVWVKRCGEELEGLRKVLVSMRNRSILYAQYDHECDEHRKLESCTARDVEKGIIETFDKELEEAFDDLAKCLGRIAHE